MPSLNKAQKTKAEAWAQAYTKLAYGVIYFLKRQFFFFLIFCSVSLLGLDQLGMET